MADAAGTAWGRLYLVLHHSRFRIANFYSVWSNSAVPTILADTDTAAVELGVKFQSSVAGNITGLSFYKCTGNTGTHVGNLWTAAGTSLWPP